MMNGDCSKKIFSLQLNNDCSLTVYRTQVFGFYEDEVTLEIANRKEHYTIMVGGFYYEFYPELHSALSALFSANPKQPIYLGSAPYNQGGWVLYATKAEKDLVFLQILKQISISFLRKGSIIRYRRISCFEVPLEVLIQLHMELSFLMNHYHDIFKSTHIPFA